MFRTKSRRSAIDEFRTLPIFAGLSHRALARVDSLMVEISVTSGSTLTVEGEIGREAFIVAEGVAEVRVDGALVGSAGPGDVVGEMALLGDGRRTATVTAVTPMRVYVLDPREFRTLADDPHVGRWITATLAARTERSPIGAGA